MNLFFMVDPSVVVERSAKFRVFPADKVSRDMPVFYNPVMILNRDLSVLFLRVKGFEGMRLVDPLAGSGVRAIRFLKELPESFISLLAVNDLKSSFVDDFHFNLSLSGLSPSDKLVVSSQDANFFLLSNKSFDYIDIDPFGSPNPFLESAVKRVRNNGFLAVTATDTAPLAGTYPKACRRKYWADPLHNFLMHEAGLRILIRKCQLVAAQYDKALFPLLSYSRDHYFRVFFRVVRGKRFVDEILNQHGFFMDKGPFWLGPLFDHDLVVSLLSALDSSVFSDDKTVRSFLSLLAEESELSFPWFFDSHALAKEAGLSGPPRIEDLRALFLSEGFSFSRTHFLGSGFKTDASFEQVLSLINSFKD